MEKKKNADTVYMESCAIVSGLYIHRSDLQHKAWECVSDLFIHEVKMCSNLFMD